MRKEVFLPSTIIRRSACTISDAVAPSVAPPADARRRDRPSAPGKRGMMTTVALALLESAQAFTAPAMRAPARSTAVTMFEEGDVGVLPPLGALRPPASSALLRRECPSLPRESARSDGEATGARPTPPGSRALRRVRPARPDRDA